jgi:hypothetical protein
MDERKKIVWRLGLLAAFAVTIISLYPQARFCYERGRAWQGTYAVVQADEPVYAAYLNALIAGRPRRNNPLTNRDTAPGGQPLPESYFSIQFVPAYMLALPARALGLTTPQVFMLLAPLMAFLTTLALFWLLATMTGDEYLASVGALCILCFGTLAAGQGAGRLLLGFRTWYDYFPFLRRYQPAPSFPFFFLFCVCVWHTLTREARRARIYAALAGSLFALLVFSYFYLWTAAAAWLACLALLWLGARRTTLRELTMRLAPVVTLALVALVPYGLMMARRVQSTDQVLMMEFTRTPDLLRVPELIGAAVLLALLCGVHRNKFAWRDQSVLLAGSFALLPFVVFNQQIITGRSLQPLHYEQFITNYTALVAVVLTIALVRRGRAPIRPHLLRICALSACAWGLLEVGFTTAAFSDYNRQHDDVVPIVQRIRQRPAAIAPLSPLPPMVFTPSIPLANNLPTYSQPILWGTHVPNFPDIAPAESRERAFQFYYYAGTRPEQLRQLLAERQFDAVNAVFSLERAVPVLTAHARPLAADEIEQAVQAYAQYCASFSRERAARLPLGYAVVPVTQQLDLTNLDRWYERDGGERVGIFLLYRLRLRD